MDTGDTRAVHHELEILKTDREITSRQIDSIAVALVDVLPAPSAPINFLHRMPVIQHCKAERQNLSLQGAGEEGGGEEEVFMRQNRGGSAQHATRRGTRRKRSLSLLVNRRKRLAVVVTQPEWDREVPALRDVSLTEHISCPHPINLPTPTPTLLLPPLTHLSAR